MKINNELLATQSPEDKADLELAKKVLSIMESIEMDRTLIKDSRDIAWLFDIEHNKGKMQHSAVSACFPIVYKYGNPLEEVVKTYYPSSGYAGAIMYRGDCVLGERRFAPLSSIAAAIGIVRRVHENAKRKRG